MNLPAKILQVRLNGYIIKDEDSTKPESATNKSQRFKQAYVLSVQQNEDLANL